MDPRSRAEDVVGAVDWQSPVSGFCQCPGAALHKQRTGARDCRVSVDGAPTVHCFHTSCSGVVAEYNRRLRRALGESHWELRLPGGQVLRSGDVLSVQGEVLRREVPEVDEEGLVLARLRVTCGRRKREILARYRWPYARILEDSPRAAHDRDAEDQFRMWLGIWPRGAVVWIGDVFSSGKPEHSTHFRTVEEWRRVGPLGNFTCGSSFKPGSWKRGNESVEARRFLVVESDTLGKDEVGAVFAYMRMRLGYELHCIVDTAGKSLHAWFDAPAEKKVEGRLKVGLEALGCDPKMFCCSQPVRVPGAYREGRLQRLIWRS